MNPEPVSTSPHVLIVDDDQLSSKLLSVLLTSAGYRTISSASSGAQALQIIEASPPRLILLDLALPDMTGIELVHRIRRHPVAGSAPIIAVTADSVQITSRRALAAGCDHYFRKPVDGRALLTVVAEYLAPANGPTDDLDEGGAP